MLEESAVVEAAAAAEFALNDNFPTQTQKSAEACQWQGAHCDGILWWVAWDSSQRRGVEAYSSTCSPFRAGL